MTVDYISKSQCNVIKGIFILIVFFSHFQQYVDEAGGRVFDTLYQRIPMLVLFRIDVVEFASWRRFLYFFMCFGITLIVAQQYERWQVRL